MSEEKTPKAIFVADPKGRERRYEADGWTLTDGTLFVNHQGVAVAVYAVGSWSSFRIDVDDAVKAATVARKALAEILAEVNRENGKNPVIIHDLADNALADLFDLGHE